MTDINAKAWFLAILYRKCTIVSIYTQLYNESENGETAVSALLSA
ncbi:hypothetical protein ATN83_3611 [Raoultella ornithinolytica]|nr:hypothetical protein ATN83_3611 [Raoultella ornithinolytica]KDV95572.1 hypothetical protein AB00_1173 [Raoultella ornithinolytica 2-156-04_S1_C1]KDX15089.1 hypothetical protein AB28_1186 [Raoultella ornithinolytica 2-156-04_S1_C2]